MVKMVKEGDIIKGDFWLEPVRVEKIEEKGNYIKLLVKGVVTGNITDRLFRKEELDSLEVINADIDFSA
ncbi:MAG: hypothetical protein ACP5P0_06570, partial [Hydrogenobacter sp.]